MLQYTRSKHKDISEVGKGMPGRQQEGIIKENPEEIV